MLRRKIQLKDITKFEWIIELKYINENVSTSYSSNLRKSFKASLFTILILHGF